MKHTKNICITLKKSSNWLDARKRKSINNDEKDNFKDDDDNDHSDYDSHPETYYTSHIIFKVRSRDFESNSFK